MGRPRRLGGRFLVSTGVDARGQTYVAWFCPQAFRGALLPVVGAGGPVRPTPTRYLCRRLRGRGLP
eukprot:4074809-Lingulodinium_polyedra.AAC.1